MKGLGLHVLLSNIASTLGRQVGAGLLQLATLAVVARVFGPEGNGAYTIALLLPTLLTSLLNLGIEPANVYYLGSRQVSPLIAWRCSLKLYTNIVVIGSAIGAIVILFFGESWFPGISKSLLWIALLIFPVSLLLALVSSMFQGLQRFGQFNLVLLLQPLLTLMIIVALLLMRIQDIAWLLFAYLTASFVTLCISLKVLKPLLVMRFDNQFAGYGKAVLSYGYKAHLSNILTFVNYKADIFLVNLLIGPGAAGSYVVAVQLSERLWLVSQAVSTVLLPRLSELSSDEDKRKVLTSLVVRWVLFITLVGSFFLAIIAFPFIKLVFGVAFLDACFPFLLLLPGVVFMAASRILANDIAARGRPELNMYASCVVVVINIVGNLFLIPRYGISGAAIATSIAYAVNFIMRVMMHHYFTRVPILNNIVIRHSDLSLLKAALFKSR